MTNEWPNESSNGLTSIASMILRWALIIAAIGFAVLLIDSLSGAQSSASGQVISGQAISGNGQDINFESATPTLAESDRLALVKRIQQAIVIVTAPDGGVGQGIVISRKPGLIATAAHVIPMGGAIRSKFSNNAETKNGRLVQSDWKTDVAIYATEIPEEIEPVQIVSADEDVAAGKDHAEPPVFSENITIGIFGRDRVLFKPISIINSGVLYADAKLHPGDSGGPVIDVATGKLVGVISGGWFWVERDAGGRQATRPARLGSGKRVRELHEKELQLSR